ncbi:MAG: DUF456 family protein [Proteobacteria bacterium]|nr:DUF456 family protein [Pseudomonadota bacterium]
MPRAGPLCRWRSRAARVGFGTWIGILLGTALKLGLAFAMLGLFAFAYLV